VHENDIAIDIIQVPSISDAVDAIYAVAERDVESLQTATTATKHHSLVTQDAVDTLSHVQQLRNPYILASCAAVIAQTDDGLG
jgi:hypothetical protein